MARQSRSRKTIGNRRKPRNDVDHGDPREKEVARTLNIRRPNPAPRFGLASFEGRRCPTPKAQLRQSAQAGWLPLGRSREAAGRRNYPEAVPTTISGHAAMTTNPFISVFSLCLIFPVGHARGSPIHAAAGGRELVRNGHSHPARLKGNECCRAPTQCSNPRRHSRD